MTVSLSFCPSRPTFPLINDYAVPIVVGQARPSPAGVMSADGDDPAAYAAMDGGSAVGQQAGYAQAGYVAGHPPAHAPSALQPEHLLRMSKADEESISSGESSGAGDQLVLIR